ncbi:hypothetical protein DB347_19415 [Opitutaceae bacterium EW11]|nr:hypothetical protein DB347_19415 [Opitutaceae bacterium EW11]
MTTNVKCESPVRWRSRTQRSELSQGLSTPPFFTASMAANTVSLLGLRSHLPSTIAQLVGDCAGFPSSDFGWIVCTVAPENCSVSSGVFFSFAALAKSSSIFPPFEPTSMPMSSGGTTSCFSLRMNSKSGTTRIASPVANASSSFTV